MQDRIARVARFGLTMRLLLLLTAAILPAMSALILVQLDLRHQRSERVAAGALHQAELLSADVAIMLDGARQLSLVLSNLDLPGGRLGCDDRLRNLQTSLHRYALLEVVDGGGAAVCRFGDDRGLALQAQVDAALASGRFTVGRLIRPAGQGTILPVIQPFRGADGRRGAIVTGFDLVAWLARMEHFRISPRDSITLADSAGTILLRLPDPALWVGHPVIAAARDLVDAPSGGVRELTGLDGVRRTIGFVPAPSNGGVYVAYGVYVPTLLAPIDQAARRGYVLIAVGALLSLLLMTLITRQLVHLPTEALLDAAGRWSAGDLTARAGLSRAGGREFARLAGAFNDMAEALNTRRQQLQQLNASLEARVAERTHALSQTNNRLLVEMNERERTDAALRRSQKFQAVGHLAGGMAHEFNNLLTVIMGTLELLQRRLGEAHALAGLLQPGIEAARRGARMTSQLLAFARRRRLMPIPLDLNAVVQDLGALLEGTVGRGVTVRLDFAGALWPALADRYEIEAAILNLALNARDALGGHGTLTIATRNVVRSAMGNPAVAGDYVELTVADDGAGMTPEELARAVDPFFTTKAPGQGAGLGLSQVHGIAQQLGGDLAIASLRGSGTTVSLFLPRASAAARAYPGEGRADCGQSHAGPSGCPTSRRPILLVDDDDEVRDVAADMLRELGYEVVAAPDAAQALELLRTRPAERRFLALVADYAMPGMSGLDLIGHARRLSPDLVTLLITGYMEVDDTAEPVKLRPEQVLRKPFTLRELADRLAQLAGATTAITLVGD